VRFAETQLPIGALGLKPMKIPRRSICCRGDRAVFPLKISIQSRLGMVLIRAKWVWRNLASIHVAAYNHRMARQILFIQGAGEGTHDNWDNKLVTSLERELGDGFAVHYPRMPGEGEPDYATWKATLTRELGALADGAILVGHSFGGTVLIDALAEEPQTARFGGLFVISAPFFGEGGWSSDGIGDGSDLSKDLPPRLPVHLYHGTTDDEVPVAHVHLHAKAIPQAVISMLKDRDHQLNDDMSEVASDIRSIC
jgi:predicted alpha/beta hydrolase family esterase